MSEKIAVQFYTLREHTQTASGFAEALARISHMGYRAVQLSAVGCMNGENPAVDAREARRMLDANGLKCVATHRNWADLTAATEAEITFHQVLGCDFAAIGGLTPAYKENGVEGYRRFLRDAKPVIEKFSDAGIAFGYHNHAHEFIRSGLGTKTLFDVFLDEGGDALKLELDLYWIAHAGLNPERIVERSHGRVPVIHVKDKEVVEKDGPVMAPVGEGNLDWDHLIPACEAAGVNWYVVEQDVCRRDPFDCLKSSYDFLVSKGL